MTREEAIKLVKSATVYTPEEMEALEILIPELKESEDEIIPQLLHNLLCAEVTAGQFEKHCLTVDSALSWLEKQMEHEQKPELCDMGRWDEESYNNGIHHVLQNPEAYGLTNQKPADWSDEDENALAYFHELISFGCDKKFCDAQTAFDMREWLNARLKSVRTYWKPSKQQKWDFAAEINKYKFKTKQQ